MKKRSETVKRVHILRVFTIVFLAALQPAVAAEVAKYDVAAIVWPAYHPAPRWAELGIFSAGKGEWQNIWEATKRRPDDLWDARPIWGYTNEADPNDVAQKIDAAVAAGINVFIYDWYWYGGRPFLEDALNKGFLGAPNRSRMKFYVMWANHDVNKYWDNTVDTKHGKEDLVWTAKVSDADWKTIVARWISQYFTQPNYYCIGGKPVLMIYRLDSFVEWEGMAKAKERLDYLRAEARKAGFPGVHLQGKIRGKVPDYRSLGIDSYTLYNWNDCHWWNVIDPVTKADPDYATCGDYALKRCDEMKAEVAEQGAAFFPNLSVGWDNNARFPISQTNRTIRNATPAGYEKYARKIRDWAQANIPPELPKLITVNSWNEWTEGGYLEPDTRWGFGYLDATRKVFVEEPGRVRWNR